MHLRKEGCRKHHKRDGSGRGGIGAYSTGSHFERGHERRKIGSPDASYELLDAEPETSTR